MQYLQILCQVIVVSQTRWIYIDIVSKNLCINVNYIWWLITIKIDIVNGWVLSLSDIT